MHFIGLGGAGGNIIEHIHRKGVSGRFTYVNGPARPGLAHDIAHIKFVPPSQREEVPIRLRQLFAADERYVLFAGLGGKTGSYLSYVLGEWLRNNNKDFLIACTLPFAFESGAVQTAQQVKVCLRRLPNFKCLALDSLKETHGQTGVSDFFALADDNLYRLYQLAA